MTIIPIPQKSASCCKNRDSQQWISLPVCPKANFRFKFSALKDTVRAVPLEGALNWLKENLQQGADIKAIEIGGPGDPLATPELTMEIATRISQEYPEIKLRIATLGLHGDQYADKLKEAGITSVSLIVQAVRPEICQEIYAWIRPGTKTLPLKEASKILTDEQRRAAQSFTGAGLDLSVKTTVYPGYNDTHIEEIAKEIASSGAKSMTLVPFMPPDVDGDEDMPVKAENELLAQLQSSAEKYMQNVSISQKSSSDLGRDCTSLYGDCDMQESMLPRPTKERPNVAVASSNGMEIDLHLGQAYQVLIYGPREDGLPCLLGTRQAPEPGGGSTRWEALAASLQDCFALLAVSAGDTPRKILGLNGVTVLLNEGEIEGTVDVLFGGGKKGKKKC